MKKNEIKYRRSPTLRQDYTINLKTSGTNVNPGLIKKNSITIMNIPIEARKCRSRSKEKEATPIIKKELNGKKIENMKNKLKKEALKKIDLYRLNKQMKPLSIDLLKTSFLSNQQNTGNSEPNSKNSNKNNNNNLQFNLKCLKTVSVNLSEKK